MDIANQFGSLALFIGGIVVLFAVLTLFQGLRISNQYERGVVFTLGRYAGTRGPGLFWVIPWISQVRKIDLRVLTIEVPPQEVITRDNVTIKVTAVVYFYVVDPAK